MTDILEYFPLAEARDTQIRALKEIQKAFSEGYRNVLLEAPVGSGKSAIAMTVARWLGGGHILTPMKSLQNQYIDDFSHLDIVSMKGRGAYPCIHYLSDASPIEYNEIHDLILNSSDVSPNKLGYETTVAGGICSGSKPVYRSCTESLKLEGKTCPYRLAAEVANEADIIIHNFSSFIYQTFYSSMFDHRPVVIIDECHKIENIIREFASRTITCPGKMTIPEGITTLDEVAQLLRQNVELYSDLKDPDTEVSPRDEMWDMIEYMEEISDDVGKVLVTEIEKVLYKKNKDQTKTYSVILDDVSSRTSSLVLSYGGKRLLMSGTIGDTNYFCERNGLLPGETRVIKLESTFPRLHTRVIAKSQYMVDTSYSKWPENFERLISNIEHLLNTFDDVKGLIHTPSYATNIQVAQALTHTGRIITHESSLDFPNKLEEFYNAKDNRVFLSPICAQGVDFKDDRARFQLILRTPYPNITDPYARHKLNTDSAWMNSQAYITFGQQLGRPVRSESDYAITVLMDSRFPRFIRQISRYLPKKVLQSIEY